MPVEPRRHEHPELGGDHGKAQAGAAEHGDLDLGEEDFRQRRIDQMVGGRRQRPFQELKDLGRETEADAKADAKGDQRIDQPAAELEQMLHQGRLGRVQRGFVFRRRLDHGAPVMTRTAP